MFSVILWFKVFDPCNLNSIQVKGYLIKLLNKNITRTVYSFNRLVSKFVLVILKKTDVGQNMAETSPTHYVEMIFLQTASIMQTRENDTERIEAL